jgi:hypothetical protein
MKEKKIIGRLDKVDLPDFGVEDIHAKIDTGAYRSSLHCKKVRLEGDILKFQVKTESGYREFESNSWVKKTIKSSNGKSEDRFVIKTRMKIFRKIYMTSFSLTDRSEMQNPMLIGTKMLKGRFLVDVSQKNLSFAQKMSSKS